MRKPGWGFIPDEDRCEVCFDCSMLNGSDIAGLSVGQWVEYELQYGFERLRGTNISWSRGNEVPVEDYDGMTMFHCHILEHEDIAMMGMWHIMGMM